MKYKIISLLLAVAPATMVAQEVVRTSTYQVGAGSTHILDTYLSQEHFSGTGLTYLYTTDRARTDRSWHTLMEHQANIAHVNDRPDQVDELQGDYTFFIGRLRRWSLLSSRLTLEAGGMAAVNLGFIYNTYNSNNPAQARFSLNVMPTGAATWRFRLFGRNAAMRYEVQMPLLGVMFSPNYGQSYYEIFNRGNYDHNIVPTTMVAYPSFRQLITLDVGLCKHVSMRIGYLGDYEQSDVNSIKHHIYSHRIMIGVVKSFQLIKHKP